MKKVFLKNTDKICFNVIRMFLGFFPVFTQNFQCLAQVVLSGQFE